MVDFRVDFGALSIKFLKILNFFLEKSFEIFWLTETSENPSVFSYAKILIKQVLNGPFFARFEIFCLKFTVFVKNFKIYIF